MNETLMALSGAESCGGMCVYLPYIIVAATIISSVVFLIAYIQSRNLHNRFKLWLGTKIMFYIMNREIEKTKNLFKYIEDDAE